MMCLLTDVLTWWTWPMWAQAAGAVAGAYTLRSLLKVKLWGPI